jgi:hypothetical protein
MPQSRVRSARRTERTYSFRGNVHANLHIVTICETVGRKTTSKNYWLAPFACDCGRGFRWSAFAADGGNVYNVFISANPKEQPHSCECKGHLQHGHKTVCRHIACTLKLIERDRADCLPSG